MQSLRKTTGGVLLAASLLVGGLAVAADIDKPVGKVAIAEKQFGLVLGGSTGGGTLTFKGKQYPFKLKGRYWFSLIMLQAIDFKLDRRDEMHLNSQYLPP